MSFLKLADALKHVDIYAISEMELVKLIRETCNKNLPADNLNYVTLHNAMIITKALKALYNKAYCDATNFIAGGRAGSSEADTTNFAEKLEIR